MTDEEARQQLAIYYAEAFGKEPGLLQQPGIHLTTISMQQALAPFFKNSALIIHAPIRADHLRPCIFMAHPQLLRPLRSFLAEMTIEQVFDARALEHLTGLVSAEFPGASVPPGGLLIISRFVTRASFSPFHSPESAGVERLDERTITHVLLLSRYSGGVYVLRDADKQIASRAGIRRESEHVWEIGVRTEVEALRGRGLAKTVVSAATEAILEAGRVPLYVHSATNVISERVALALGYQHYADQLLWYLP
ncbi:MAG TPA: GNAT family N-acetyltransferase [Ktedonobacterales bacterium]|nr:GNAT family N-acetyltransferase [Ktedonobacterales bacterium]